MKATRDIAIDLLPLYVADEGDALNVQSKYSSTNALNSGFAAATFGASAASFAHPARSTRLETARQINRFKAFSFQTKTPHPTSAERRVARAERFSTFVTTSHAMTTNNI